MIAPLPQTVAGLNVPVKATPVLPGPAVIAFIPAPAAPDPAVTVQPATAAPPNKAAAFTHAWAAALEQVESATAQRLKSTKSLALPLAEPKPAPQIHSNENAGAGIFENARTNEKTEPLPLVLSFVAPQPQPPEVKDSSNQTCALSSGERKNDSSFRSAPSIDSDDEEESLPRAAGDVAFTAKFKTPESAMTAQPAPAATSASAASSLLAKNTGVLQMVDASALAKPVIDAAPALASLSTTVVAAPADALATSTKIASPFHLEPIEPAANAATAAPQPMKEIAFQLPGARGVEVRLTEQAGEVRMDVRTGNTALTQDLRGNLHDLVSGLERKGISAEVSHLPDHATTPTARSADTGAFKDQTPGGGQGGAFDRQPQQRHRQPGQAPAPPSSKARTAAWQEQAISNFGKEN